MLTSSNQSNEVLETTDFVVSHAKHVTIVTEKLEKFARLIADRQFLHWLQMAPASLPSGDTKFTLQFVAILNSISFCYWGEPKWRVKQSGMELDGTWGLLACLRQAHDNGFPICSAEVLANVTQLDFDRITQGNVTIPLLRQRTAILNEVGKTLLTRFHGQIQSLVESVDYEAGRFVRALVDAFPSFEDVRTYGGKKIYFRKRAQLLASDIDYVLSLASKGAKKLFGVGELTACADYKLPQVLRKHGVLEYSAHLAQMVDRQTRIPENAPEEVEIRAATIWAIEGISKVLTNIRSELTSPRVNDEVWLMGQLHSSSDRPYHRTVTTSY